MKFFIASKGAYDVICTRSPLRSSEVINAKLIYSSILNFQK